MIWIFINGRILGRSLLPVHTFLLRVSYCELVRKFMDDVTTLVSDKRRRCRLLRRVLCLVQSSQPSSKNIFRRRAKVEKKRKQTKKNVYTATVRYRNTVFLFCCVCGSLCQKLPVLLVFWMCLFDLYKVSCRWEHLERRVIDVKYAAGIILTHLQ